MTIYATMNPVGSISPKDLKDNAQNLDLLMLGPLPSYSDRRGVNRLSWQGIEDSFRAAQASRAAIFDTDQASRLASFNSAQAARATQYSADKLYRDTTFSTDQATRSGLFVTSQSDRTTQFNAMMAATTYEAPIPYTAGIVLDRVTKTVSNAGIVYRVQTAFMPFTTTGVFATDAAKLVVVGDNSLQQKIADPTDAAKGAGIVGYDPSMEYPVNTSGFGLNHIPDNLGGRTGLGLQFAAGKTLRIYHGGTSIENSSASGTRQFIASLTRQYGDSGNVMQLLALLGGNYDSPRSGWKKQPFGGTAFNRLRGEAASTAFSLNGYGSRFTLRYSTETDGGSFDVWIDGVFSRAISCNGAQSVNNESTWTFAEGNHTIEFKPPASGYAYLETLEYCLDRNGIQMFDASYGGSSLSDMTILRTPSAQQVAGVPIVGYSALDGMFNNVTPNYKPDLFIVAWTVNDAGRGLGTFNSNFKPNLQRIVDTTRTLGVPLLLIVEMGGHYTMANNPNNPSFAAIRALMRSFIKEPHVTVLDWHQLAGGDVLTIPQFIARYYPGATVNETTGTVTGGDFTHPNQAGHSLVPAALSARAGVPGIARMQENENAWYQRIRQKGPLIGVNALPAYSDVVNIGQERSEVNSQGIKYRYTAVGYSSNLNEPQRDVSPLYASRDEVNLHPGLNDSIATSGLSDRYGNYLQIVNQVIFLNTRGLPANADVTVTLIIGSGNWSHNARNEANTANLEQFSRGQSIGLKGFISGTNALDQPQVLHYTVRPGARIYTATTAKLYACYVTPTSFPCKPIRETFKLREVGGPMYMVGDTPSGKVQVGQVYFEAINGKTVEKVCVGQRVFKVNDGKFYSLYRVQNRTLAGLITYLTLGGTVTIDAYSESFGGTPQITNAATPIVTVSQQAWVAESKYTLTGKVAGITNLTIAMVNSSTNTTLFYNPTTDLWSASGGFVTFTALDGEQLAVTMTMPTAAQLAGLPFRLDVRQNGGAGSLSKWGVFTLVDGSSACI